MGVILCRQMLHVLTRRFCMFKSKVTILSKLLFLFSSLNLSISQDKQLLLHPPSHSSLVPLMSSSFKLLYPSPLVAFMLILLKPFMPLIGNSEIIHCTVKLNPIFNHISLGAPEDSSLSNGRNSNEDQAAVFWIQGVIERQELCPSWLHPTKSYSCVGFATNGPSFSGWFQELMAALSKQNLLLVSSMIDAYGTCRCTFYTILGLLHL